ncbi:hypothetical protein JCM5350_001106, partial [Sporobolomyces pararoseus]
LKSFPPSQNLPPLSSSQEIDTEVEQLTNDLAKAIKSSTPLLRPSSHSKPWWSDEISQLVKVASNTSNFAYSHRGDGIAQTRAILARKHVKAAIKRAKNQYQSKIIENVTDQNLFETLHKSSKRSKTTSLPPLVRPDSTLALSYSDKVSLLRSTLLPSSPSSNSGPDSRQIELQTHQAEKEGSRGEGRRVEGTEVEGADEAGGVLQRADGIASSGEREVEELLEEYTSAGDEDEDVSDRDDDDLEWKNDEVVWDEVGEVEEC